MNENKTNMNEIGLLSLFTNQLSGTLPEIPVGLNISFNIGSIRLGKQKKNKHEQNEHD